MDIEFVLNKNKRQAKPLLLLVWVVCSLFLPVMARGVEPVPVRVPVYAVWMSGTEGRHAYDQAVVLLSLEKSRDKYGPFKLKAVEGIAEIERARIQASKADRFQIHMSPDDEVIREGHDSFIQVPSPIIKGLLGYRRLLVHKDLTEKFSRVTTVDELRAFTVGQGVRWADVGILRENGFTVTEIYSMDSLFGMLNKKRFDFISLGLNESEGTLVYLSDTYPDFRIVENITLFFPMSIFMYVSSKYPELAERLEYGLKKAKNDGSFDRLFMSHFSEKIEELHRKDMQVFYLRNTTISTLGASQEPLLLK